MSRILANVACGIIVVALFIGAMAMIAAALDNQAYRNEHRSNVDR